MAGKVEQGRFYRMGSGKTSPLARTGVTKTCHPRPTRGGRLEDTPLSLFFRHAGRCSAAGAAFLTGWQDLQDGGETQRAHRAGRSAETSLRRMLGRGPLGNAGWFSVCSCGGCPEPDAKHPLGRSGRSVCGSVLPKCGTGTRRGRIRSMTCGPSAFTPCRAIYPEIRKNRKEEWSNSRNPLLGRGTKFGHTRAPRNPPAVPAVGSGAS